MEENLSRNPSTSPELPTPGNEEERPLPLVLLSGVQKLQQAITSALQFAGGFGVLSGQIAKELLRPPFYPRLLVQQLYDIGVRSLILVTITALATGSVLALQFGYGLARFGGKLYVPKIVALSIVREMGPVFTSLLVAGRIGSGIASQVASMKVTQQIDAIRALGTSPIKRIVIPRVLAAVISFPILTLIADFVGLWGAMFVCQKELGINSEYFYSKTLDTLQMTDFTTGLAKTCVFAYFTSVVACWKGLTTEGGTEGVGNSTTWVIVAACIFVMIGDFFLTKFFILTVMPNY